MISLLEIAQTINESDDDKYVSIGFGRFKLKGKEDDDDADVFVKTDSGKYVKSADQKSDDDGGKKPEEPQGGKLGGSDFERDLDSDDNEESDDEEKSAESENEKIIGALEDMDLDGLNVDSLDSAIDSGQYASITGKDDDPDNEMSVNAFTGEDGKVEYGINVGVGHKMIYFDSKEEALEAAQKLFKDDKIRKAMDGEGDETLADLGDHANSIVKGKDETININLKEKYDRIFRSLK